MFAHAVIRSFIVSITKVTDAQWAHVSNALTFDRVFSTSAAFVTRRGELRDVAVPAGFITSGDFPNDAAVQREVIERCGMIGIVLTIDDVHVSEPNDHLAAT